MRGNQYENFVGERVTILTEGERIEGSLYYIGGVRMSDFLNSPNQQESRFVKLKDPIVHCRRTGEEMARAPFLMVACDRIVLVLTHSEDPAAPSEAAQRVPMGRETLPRSFR